MIPVVFRSTARILTLHSDPRETSKVVNGQVVRTFTNDFRIEFKNHVYATTNPKHIEMLRKSRAYGKLFVEQAGGSIAEATKGEASGSSASSPKAADGEPKAVSGISSKNAAVAFLVKECGAEAKEFAGKKAEEVAEIAVTKYNVQFTDWNS